MSWARLDDKFHRHPKVRQLRKTPKGREALGTWVFWLSYCGEDPDLTGFVPLVELPASDLEAAKLLVDVGLWEEVDDGYAFHDFGDYNLSERALARRERDRERKATKRAARTPRGHSSGRGLPGGPDNPSQLRIEGVSAHPGAAPGTADTERTPRGPGGGHPGDARATKAGPPGIPRAGARVDPDPDPDPDPELTPLPPSGSATGVPLVPMGEVIERISAWRAANGLGPFTRTHTNYARFESLCEQLQQASARLERPWDTLLDEACANLGSNEFAREKGFPLGFFANDFGALLGKRTNGASHLELEGDDEPITDEQLAAYETEATALHSKLDRAHTKDERRAINARLDELGELARKRKLELERKGLS